MLLLITLE